MPLEHARDLRLQRVVQLFESLVNLAHVVVVVVQAAARGIANHGRMGKCKTHSYGGCVTKQECGGPSSGDDQKGGESEEDLRPKG